jgi:hypothetical protein
MLLSHGSVPSKCSCHEGTGHRRPRQGNLLAPVGSSKAATANLGIVSQPADGVGYWQPGNLKLAILVLQLNVPFVFRYSFVYQKVQSSTGSTVMAL